MYIDIVPNRNSPPAVLLREYYFDSGKWKKRTVANLSHLDPAIVENLRIALKGATLAPIPDVPNLFETTRSLPHGHVAAILGTIRNLQLDKLIAPRPGEKRNLLLALIASRLIAPASKLATATSLHQEVLTTSLPDCLGIEEISEDDFYEAMDWLLDRQESIEAALATRHLHDGSLILYDVTSTYFEGKTCPLVKLGHSRDGKKGLGQIVFGILADHQGCPVAVEVFSGNTGDPSTIPSQIKKIQKKFGLKNVILVGDRGMITEARLRDNFMKTDELDWITALRSPAIKDLLKRGVFQPGLFDEMRLGEIQDPNYPNERLIVCRNPDLAEERREKREALLAATEKKLDEIVQATRRKRKPLRGKDVIGLRVGKVLGKYKMGKHFQIAIEEASFSYARKSASIEMEAATDGFYIIRTSVDEKRMAPEEVVEAYKNLANVERAFRCLKGIDLRVRPIYHSLERRVRSHIFLCMLAYYVEWHMRRDLAPLLYADEFKELAKSERETIVDSAKRSSACQEKLASKQTIEDGLPLEDFQTLLKNLGTITQNTNQLKNKAGGIFKTITKPTKAQQKAFSLLKVKL